MVKINNRPILFLTLSLVLAMVVASCAKQGYPSGGPRDITPPTVVSMHPATATTQFDARSFSITFDEFVVLNDVDNNIIISPPLHPKPQYSIKGKSLLVQLPDTLQPNVTYLFQMHGAVADFTEGNRIGALEYAFSTGNTIDSLSMQGRVIDAYQMKPSQRTVTVMLYHLSSGEEWTDSTVTRMAPAYVARCDEEGHFRFNHMADGEYRIIAIDDADRNFRYNGNEAVAFLDTVLRPNYLPTYASDSTHSDSTAADSLVRPTVQPLSNLTLYISCDSSQAVQRVTKSEFVAPSRIVVATAAPMQAPQLTCSDSLVWRINGKGDSLQIWVRRPHCDSTVVMLRDASGIDDTLTLQLRKPAQPRRRVEANGEADTVPSFAARFLFGTTVGVFDTLRLRVDNPVIQSCDTAVRFFDLVDSVWATAGLRFDSLALCAWIDTVLTAGHKYQCTLPAGMLTDLWGSRNSQAETTVEIQSEDRYGNIFLTCRDPLPEGIILQLTNDQDKVLSSQSWPVGQSRIALRHLAPGKYRIQAFHDVNGDGKWTAGNYWLHRQPESIYRFEKTLEVRENWDIEETWQMLR